MRESKVIAFQGEPGAYSEQAAYGLCGSEVNLKPCETLAQVFDLVSTDRASAGVVPIENSLEGSITETYDLLLSHDLRISREYILKIVHCVIAKPGSTLESIKEVYSHPQALAQCRRFLSRMAWRVMPAYDTAGSVKMIKDMKSAAVAAIAARRAAELHGMMVIAEGIQDQAENYTRFFLISNDEAIASPRDKTSIIFSVKHEPGTLYTALREFASRGINLTRIESRPSRMKPWEYNFYLDFEGRYDASPCKEALARLSKKALFVKVLGSYPRAGVPPAS